MLLLKEMIDEPHEKLYTVSLLIIVFSFVHYSIYLRGSENYVSSTKKELTYADFLWYSLMVMLTMPMGDIHPASGIARAATGIQGAVFLTVILF